MSQFLFFALCFFLSSCSSTDSLNRGYVISHSHVEGELPPAEKELDAHSNSD